MKRFVACLSALLVLPLSAQWSAGIVSIAPTSPYVDIDNDIRVFPVISYEGERLVWRGPSLSYKLSGLQRGKPSWSLTLNLGPNELDAEESSRLSGIEDRDFSILASVRYQHPMDFASFSFSAETDVSGKHDGQRIVVGLERPLFIHAKRKWIVNAGIEAEYLSENYTDYYFGVSAAEQSVSSFMQYSVESVVQPSLTLGGYYQFNANWQFIGSLRWQVLADEIKDSPIVDSPSAVNGFAGVVYAF